MQALRDLWVDSWPVLAAVLHFAVMVGASAHVLVHKRDARAAIGWVGLVCLTPLVGALLYWALGVNRIRRRAVRLRGQRSLGSAGPAPREGPVERLHALLAPDALHLAPLSRLVGRLTGHSLVDGNHLHPCFEGTEAYDAMLAAIDAAERSVLLTTYIFDRDEAGRRFRDSLAAAVRRGVAVRVLIDGVGARYSFPSMLGELQDRGVRAAAFLPPRLPWRFQYANLRHHRKILVVDGRVGFTGGMNIRAGSLAPVTSRHALRDLQVRVVGPVVHHLLEVAAFDWTFATGEVLEGERWRCEAEGNGPAMCRGIPEGPDEDFGKLRWTILAALGCARHSIRIVTPYFVPDPALISALDVAALRGVTVDVVLPQRSNLKLVQWASTALLWQILEHGCRVHLTPPPFDHTKILVVDDVWSLVGSANWDARSLRLNFEFDLECYDRGLAGKLAEAVDARIAAARPVSLADVDGRPLPVKLRDGAARLFTPYL